jgi:glycogen synthase
MKILILSNFYPPNIFGGYERLCFEVACSLKDRGHAVNVLTSSYGFKASDTFNHEVKRDLFLFANEESIYQPFNCSSDERLSYEKNNREVFNAVIDEVKPDVIFIWNMYFFGLDLLREIESSEVKKCFFLTDNWLIAQRNPAFIEKYFFNTLNHGRPIKKSLLLKLKSLYRKLRPNKEIMNLISMRGKAIYPSLFMDNLYKKSGFKFDLGEKVCYHGVRFFNPKKIVKKNRFNLIKHKNLKLLFAGRIVDIKGVHVAIKALHEIKKSLKDLDVVLTIVGDIQDQIYFSELDKLINFYGLQKLVIFQPAVAESNLFELFQEHDIYLFPSLYEPFSLTLILALESGIPTIASNVCGNPEIIDDGKTGLLFEAGDSVDLAKKIHVLALNDDLRKRLSQDAAAHASNFTFNRMMDQIELILEKD